MASPRVTNSRSYFGCIFASIVDYNSREQLWALGVIMSGMRMGNLGLIIFDEFFNKG